MYPAASFRPIARPLLRGPTRSIFMFTVIDQARPWLTPSSRLAATIQPHAGAQASRNGPGDQQVLAGVPGGQLTGRQVGQRLGDPERDDEAEHGQVASQVEDPGADQA